MRTLLALLVVCGSALAQSGTITLGYAPTNNARVLDLPPPDEGMTRLALNVESTFDLTCNVWSTYAIEAPVAARFCGVVEVTEGSTSHLLTSNRRRLDLLCGFGETSAFGVLSVSGAAVFTIPPQPLVLHNRVRSRVEASIPFGEGTLVHQTIVRSRSSVSYTYLP